MVKFSEMELRKEIVDALNGIGLVEAFPIQEAAMPHILKGDDVIGQAHTGTGKTFAFSIPLVQKINPSSKETTALILVPTRELALQVADEIKKVSKYAGIRSIAIYGGVSLKMQFDMLKWGQQIVIATPGRLIDMMNRNAISLRNVKYLVLDEADRMFDMGFIEDIQFIIKTIPKERQTLLFSATMPDDIMRLTERYMKHPVKILLDSDELSADLITQTYLVVEEREKLKHLSEILSTIKGKVLIFCSTKYRTRRLANDLYARGSRAVAIHGDLSQNQREDAIRKFKEGRINILVATDVVARGIDVPRVEQVINFDVPMNPLMYFHRIGRTARAGEAGKALTLVSQHQYDDFQNILKHTEVFIEQLNEKMGIKVEHVDGYRRESHERRDFRPRGHNFGGRREFRRGSRPNRRSGRKFDSHRR
ncbi:MAG: DEAD/DEAH box helicase [Candidatus Aenigmarchaeota archaeon]|nr:DEAD/DEAH box helicase [Candidatus Aenigmarchaeota archaeon]